MYVTSCSAVFLHFRIVPHTGGRLSIANQFILFDQCCSTLFDQSCSYFFVAVCPNATGGSSTVHSFTAFLTALGLTGVAVLLF